MSDAMDRPSCIRHRDTARYITYYEDYQEISKKNPDKIAAFLRVLEVKTNKKLVVYEAVLEDAVNNDKGIPELSLWIEVSYNDFVYWSLKTMGRSSFQVADKEAQAKLLIKSRVLKRHIRPSDPESPEVPYKEYLLVTENVQAMIDGKELPITGKAYEEYGDVPPVLENIPLLQKTWDMLQKTRAHLLQKTYPPVVKNRLINKDTKDNLPKESNKDITLVDSPVFVDSAHADIDELLIASSLSESPSHKEKDVPEKKSEIQVQQPQLLENGPPATPAKTAKWNAETLVQIVEAKRNKRFEEVVRTVKGKICKTQRERQLEAAKSIVLGKFTREQFEQAYDYRNDEWWIERKGDLTVVDMVANTSKHVMRLIEVLESIAVAEKKMGKKAKNAPAPTLMSGPILPGMTHDEAIQVAAYAMAQGKQHGYDIKANTYANGDAWLLNVVWDGDSLAPIESRTMWNKEFKETHEMEQKLLEQSRKKEAK